MSKQPKPGQVWIDMYGDTWEITYVDSHVAIRAPVNSDVRYSNRRHMTMDDGWPRWSATATLISEGGEQDG